MLPQNGRFPGPPFAALDIQNVVDGVDGQHAQRGQQQQRDQPLLQSLIHGQFKQVKANVPIEDGIIGAKRNAVKEQQKFVPAHGDRAGKAKREEERYAGQNPFDAADL